MKLINHLPRFIFHISEIEKHYRRIKHLNKDGPNADRIWEVGQAYFSGYNLALNHFESFELLVSKLDKVPNEMRGFAYEGAGTVLTILDMLPLWKSGHLNNFIDNYAFKHIKTIYAGAGLAFARLGRNSEDRLKSLNLNQEYFEYFIDGYAFYQGCIKNTDLEEITLPSWLKISQKNIFTRGIGRSLWFRHNGNIHTAHQMIEGSNNFKKDYLWKGFGVACAYAGLITESNLEELKSLSNESFQFVIEGFEIAYKARTMAEIPANHTSSTYQYARSLRPL